MSETEDIGPNGAGTNNENDNLSSTEIHREEVVRDVEMKENDNYREEEEKVKGEPEIEITTSKTRNTDKLEYKRTEFQFGDNTVQILTINSAADNRNNENKKKMVLSKSQSLKSDNNNHADNNVQSAKEEEEEEKVEVIQNPPLVSTNDDPPLQQEEKEENQNESQNVINYQEMHVMIEMCKDCHLHQMSTKHDENKYKSYFDRVCEAIRSNFADAEIELLNANPRLGAFEVYLTVTIGEETMSKESIFSKIQSRAFPNPYDIPKLIEKRLIKST